MQHKQEHPPPNFGVHPLVSPVSNNTPKWHATIPSVSRAESGPFGANQSPSGHKLLPHRGLQLVACRCSALESHGFESQKTSPAPPFCSFQRKLCFGAVFTQSRRIPLGNLQVWVPLACPSLTEDHMGLSQIGKPVSKLKTSDRSVSPL